MLVQTSTLSKKNKKYLDLACKLARQSECSIKHGAVLVKGGSVVAVGFNKPRNNSVTGGGFYTTHAEIDCINQAGKTLGATLYVARINSRGAPMFSRPCENCMKAIQKAGIRKVYYT